MSVDLNQLLNGAMAFHQQGDLASAETAYRQLLAAVPTMVDVHYLLGMACLGQGKNAAAVASLRTATAMKPDRGEWKFNLGVALRSQGDLAGARAAFLACLPLYAGQPVLLAPVWAELGSVEAALGDMALAEQRLRAALDLSPGLSQARHNLAGLLVNRYREDAELRSGIAVTDLHEAVRLAPDMLEARHRLALALLRADRAQEALDHFDILVAADSSAMAFRIGRADALTILGRLADARSDAEIALAVDPADPAGHIALAAAFLGQGALADAVAALRRALEMEPGSLAALTNLGTVLYHQGDDDGAEVQFAKALAQYPDSAATHWQRAQARLMAGDFAQGWAEYEWRWQMPGFPLSPALTALPVWDGRTVPQGRLLVHAEQGHGDTLQFIRLVPMLMARGLSLLVQVQPALVRLVTESLPQSVAVAALGTPLPADVRCRCPLLGLPLRLDLRDLSQIPADMPYLTVPDDRRKVWRQRMQTLAGVKIGLVWAGDSRAGDPRAAATDKRRSIALSALAPLARVAGVTFISLQKGPKAAEAAQSPFPLVDWTDELGDFADTAALIANLDMVIGVDTAVIHLAGALGCRVWVLSRFDGCWRWLRRRWDNPWYPSLTLFRQQQWADWGPAIADMVNALERVVQQRLD